MRETRMIEFFKPKAISRRDLLQMSGLGLGAAALAALMNGDGLFAADVKLAARRLMDVKSRAGQFPAQATGVIQLVMTGGPSQVDLFDYKPELQRRDGQEYEIPVDALQKGSEANLLMASPFKFSRHGECGMELSELVPHLATIVDDICLVRSLVSVHNNHTEAIVNLACGKMFIGRPTLGAWISYGLGTENQDLPAFVVLRDPAGYSTSGGLMSKSGWMPAMYGGTEFSASGPAVHNLQPARDVPMDVQRRGLEFLKHMNERHRQRYPYELELETRLHNYELAARMQLTASNVLDISRETESTKKLYGLDNPRTASYGTRCLMARRLVEAGVRFVQVFSEKGQPWDHHENIKSGLVEMCAKTDLPTVGLVNDLKQRGMLDSTIVLWSGEFGRLPVGQNGNGRDHNKRAGSFWIAGGGFKSGHTYGATDDVSYSVIESAFSVPDMFACILHQLGLDHRLLAYQHAGRSESATDGVVTGARVHPEILARTPYI